MAADSAEGRDHRAGEPAGPSAPPGDRRRPLELGRARRSAIEALRAYRQARDPASLVEVFQALADDLPAHWVIAGLLSVSSQLVDYLAASEKVDADDVVRALASIDIEDELADEPADEPADGRAADAAHRRDEALLDEQVAESFPASDPPSTWAGPPETPPTDG